MRAAMRRPWHSCARTRHPFRALNPHILVKDSTVRRYLLARLKAFRAEYREAQRRWAAGDMSVVFPYGTLDLPHLPRLIARAPPDRCFLTP